MRNFERQADLYSAAHLGAMPIIRALEKIAFLSGKSRDLPNWHHFSIRERVDCLLKARSNPLTIKRHNRFVLLSVLVYLACISGLVYVSSFAEFKQNLGLAILEKTLKSNLKTDPNNVKALGEIAMIYHELGRLERAVDVYEKIIRLAPDHAFAMNNLAWILATSPDAHVRDAVRALELAKSAVHLEESPEFLDTLAEAHFINGNRAEAINAIDKALQIASENHRYYQSQRKRFLHPD
jgi:tetratricopeptide (TPR) repeat protein